MKSVMPATDTEQRVGTDHSIDATEACYVYRPAGTAAGGGQRPKKRRKTAPVDGDSSSAQSRNDAFFVPLLNGKESAGCVAARAVAYETMWKSKERNLEKVLEEANAMTVHAVFDFISATQPPKVPSRIPTGFVTTGLATSSSGSIFSPIAVECRNLSECIVVPVSAAECPNLKTALKAIIRNGTAMESGDGPDELLADSKEGIRLLNYDLQALFEFVLRKSVGKCVLFFQNSEALDGHVLSELVDVLSSWQDRIPFVLLLEIAVSVDLFQEKMSRTTVRRLQGSTFESRTASEILDVMFRSATNANESNPLWLGPAASKLLLDRQTEHIQSAKGFISALKYMYMTHFFTNSLTILMSETANLAVKDEHIDAIRKLPSFKRYIEDLKENRQASMAQNLLKDNVTLKEAVPAILSQSRKTLRDLYDALEVLSRIHDCAPTKAGLTWSTLYIKALSGDLADSPLLRELSLSVRKLPSDRMAALIASLSSIETLDLGSAASDLAALTKKSDSAPSPTSKRANGTASTTNPLRSEYDTQHSTMRTTVISQKVALTRHKADLSAADAAYSKFVTRIDLLLKGFFSANLASNPPSLSIPFSEILIFDSGKSAVSNALGGAPRAAVERALSRPADYLACECCDVEEGRLVGSTPATSLVWQLVGEGGVLINVEDLWRAFRAVVEPEADKGTDGEKRDDEEGDEEEEEDRRENELLALFYRALAELKYLGMIKQSRKKADHLMKVRWKGL